jgi:hypothetical protein
MIEIHNAFVLDKSSLVGETVNYYDWEESQFEYFLKCLEWLDKNFVYHMRAESNSLRFFILKTLQS